MTLYDQSAYPTMMFIFSKSNMIYRYGKIPLL